MAFAFHDFRGQVNDAYNAMILPTPSPSRSIGSIGSGYHRGEMVSTDSSASMGDLIPQPIDPYQNLRQMYQPPNVDDNQENEFVEDDVQENENEWDDIDNLNMRQDFEEDDRVNHHGRLVAKHEDDEEAIKMKNPARYYLDRRILLAKKFNNNVEIDPQLYPFYNTARVQNNTDVVFQ